MIWKKNRASWTYSIQVPSSLSTLFIITINFFWYICILHPELQILHSAFLPDSSIIKVEIYRSSKVKQTVHYTKINLIYRQSKALAMPFINLTKDSSQRLLQSVYVVITVQMPVRCMWHRLDIG